METFERLGETVQLCNVYCPLEDFDKTDEIVTQLYLIIDEVEALIDLLRKFRSAKNFGPGNKIFWKNWSGWANFA